MQTRILAAVLLPLTLSATTMYRVVDLGAGAATAIGAGGQTAGWTVTASGGLRATGPDRRVLEPGRESRALGVNGAGDAVGIRFDARGNAEGVVWHADGTSTALGGANSYVTSINEAGVMAGAASGRAARFSAGLGAVDLGVNAPWSAAYGVNAAGAIAGTAQLANGAFRAFTRDAQGGVTFLGALGGAASYGQAINDAGWAAGGALTARGYLHAFLYDGGRMHDLGTLGGGNSSAYGVNGRGQAVGFAQDRTGESSAFLWENGQLLDLNWLIAVNAGWRLAEARAINDRGQIAGWGWFNGGQRAFRLDPFEPASADAWGLAVAAVPEPGSWLLLTIGLAGVAFGSARRSWDED